MFCARQTVYRTYTDQVKRLQEIGVPSRIFKEIPERDEVIARILAIVRNHADLVNAIEPINIVIPNKDLSLEKKISNIKYNGIKGFINFDHGNIINVTRLPFSKPYINILPQRGIDLKATAMTIDEVLSLYLANKNLIKEEEVLIRGSFWSDGKEQKKIIFSCSEDGPKIDFFKGFMSNRMNSFYSAPEVMMAK